MKSIQQDIFGLSAIGVSVIMVLSLAIISHRRNHAWHNVLSLSSSIACRSPHKARVYVDLGNALDDNGRWEEAIAAYRKATALDPYLQSAYYNLGLAYFRRSRFSEAKEAFLFAQRLNSEDREVLDYLRAIGEIAANKEF